MTASFLSVKSAGGDVQLKGNKVLQCPPPHDSRAGKRSIQFVVEPMHFYALATTSVGERGLDSSPLHLPMTIVSLVVLGGKLVGGIDIIC